MDRIVFRLTLGITLCVAASALAAPPAVALRQVASGFASPLEIAHAGDGSGRLFVVEKGGRVKILRAGAVLSAPFLDVSARIAVSGERGLLGLAFHPQFASNRKFYVYYTRLSDGAIVVSEFLTQAANPDLADIASERVVITIPHPTFDNHNGGKIAFGPDRYLYIATGDGGSGGDPSNNAQNLSSLLGKLLRIDVNTASGYQVPPSNPLIGISGARPEIWAFGLRNPWKFSFDRTTGDLFIADVGQGAWEEVNLEPSGDVGGRNYGWRVLEGTHCFNPSTGCSALGTVLPIIEYGHNAQGGNSITGGYRYRGKRSHALRGFYLYGDFISNRVWAAEFSNGAWSTNFLFNATGGVSSFGEDEAGELYLASFGEGAIYAIDGAGPALATQSDFNADGRSDILWWNAQGGAASREMWLMNAFTATSGASFSPVESGWSIVGRGDFNGDGKADILWRNATDGSNGIWLMNGPAVAATGLIPPVKEAGWTIAGVGDFNGDGKADILWRNATDGRNAIWLMNGLAVTATGLVTQVADAAWTIVGVADFNGDGKADILWRNVSDGKNAIWLVDGLSITATALITGVANQDWRIVGTGDFNGDRKADILWRNTTSGQNAIWLMNSFTLSNSALVQAVTDPAWTIAATGDYDGDGNDDILWRQVDTGQSAIWLIDGTTVLGAEFTRAPGSP